jgi:alpha-glucuronidase
MDISAISRRIFASLSLCLLSASAASAAPATFPLDETGYEAWLRYTDKTESPLAQAYASFLQVHNAAEGHTLPAVMEEWARAMEGFLGQTVETVEQAAEAGVVFSIDDSLEEEGYQIKYDGQLHISGGSERGLLYGTFASLQKMQRETPVAELAESSAPYIPIRMLNHWDNVVVDPVMGSIERVYGGNTIFDWTDLSYPNPRYEDYARMLASIGINATCLNNVNADPEILSGEMIEGLASLAEIFRKWGIQVYVSVNFGSPVFLGELSTADPLDPRVQAWWKDKADEIYAKIPDFGGFIVKADSEGKPGPGTYGRSHVEGSRCIAQALQPHGGLLFWRAFVYAREDIAERIPLEGEALERAINDRANHATYEFMDLDGQFEDNVILQVKLSGVDFQISEPVHTLFGLMPQTRMCVEADLAKEYKGYDTTIAWEGHYLDYVLNFETGWGEPTATVAEVVAGKTQNHLPGAITAVANINNAKNWFGHLLSGASLYTYGKQAWNPQMDTDEILQAYGELTFGREAAPIVAQLLDGSYQTMAKYMGLMGGHSFSEILHHYEPDPWGAFDHKVGVTEEGIGMDRSVETGTGYLGLYHPDVAAMYADPATISPEKLLYFHHLAWDYEMPDGRTLTQTLYDRYYEGAEEVQQYAAVWRQLHGVIDLARWAHVYDKMAKEAQFAERWRDLMCRYLLEKSGISDAHNRFWLNSPSPHNRLRTGAWQAFADYRARVERETQQLNAEIEERKKKEAAATE